jgi:hypothetical protein
MKAKKSNCKLKEKVKKHEKKEDAIYKKLEKENKKFEKRIK